MSKGGGGGGGGERRWWNVGGGGDGNEDPKVDDKKDKKDPPKIVIPSSEKEASNLLPGQTVSLCRLDIEKLRNSPAGILFDRTLLEMFQKSFGISADQVAVYHHAYVGDARDPFGVIRLTDPVVEKDIVSKMAPSGAPKPIKKKWNLYKCQSNPFVNGASNALSFGSLLGELYDKLPAAPGEKSPESAKPQPPRAIGLCVYDTQHILVGDYAQLEKFLNNLTEKGDPKFLSDTAGEGVALTDTRQFLSIDPKLKRALRELGAESQTPPPVVFVEKYTVGAYNPKLLKEDYHAIGVVLDPVLNQTEILGANIVSFSEKHLTATIRLVMKSDGAAFDVVKNTLSPSLTIASQFLSLYLHSPVEFRNLSSAGGTGTPMTPGMGSPLGPPPGMGSLGPPPGMGIPSDHPGRRRRYWYSAWNGNGAARHRSPGAPRHGHPPGWATRAWEPRSGTPTPDPNQRSRRS